MKLTCKLCGHEWETKGDKKSLSCPRCKRYDYSKDTPKAKEGDKK